MVIGKIGLEDLHAVSQNETLFNKPDYHISKQIKFSGNQTTTKQFIHL